MTKAIRKTTTNLQLDKSIPGPPCADPGNGEVRPGPRARVGPGVHSQAPGGAVGPGAWDNPASPSRFGGKGAGGDREPSGEAAWLAWKAKLKDAQAALASGADPADVARPSLPIPCADHAQPCAAGSAQCAEKPADAVLPPYTNRGVVPRGQTACVDWLRFSKPGSTIPLEDIIEDVTAIFTSTRSDAWGGHGYRGLDLALYGKLLWRPAGTDSNDFLMDLPGQAMQYIRECLKISDQQICEWFLSKGWKAKRVDVALDTDMAEASPAVVWRHWQVEALCCEALTASLIQSSRRGSSALSAGQGQTVYIGSRQSSRFCRVYDKVAETLHKTGEILCYEDGTEVKQLTRFELECKDEAAQAVALLIADKGDAVIPSILGGWIDFKKLRSRNKRRWERPTTSWWEELTKSEKVKLGLSRGLATPERSLRWLRQSVASTLKLVREYRLEPYIEMAVKAANPSVVKRSQWDAWIHGQALLEHSERRWSPEDRAYLELLAVGVGPVRAAEEALAQEWAAEIALGVA